MTTKFDTLLAGLHWLGHDSFRLDGPPVIWFDPWKLKGHPAKADLVLVSHEHFDHCSPDDVDKLRGPGTVVLASPAAAVKLPGARVMRAGDQVRLRDITVQAVPAYNLDKFRAPGKPFHPRQAGHVGWIVDFGGLRIYHAGDTDLIPEMRDICCDVALLPVSGTYVMTLDEAVRAARALRPKVAVPMHYGAIVGAETDGASFAERYEGVSLVLKPEG